MEEIIITFQCFLGSWFLADFQPLQDQWDKLFKKVPQTALNEYLYTAVGCHKCLSMWITLAFTWNIFFAIGAAMLSQIYQKLFRY